MANLSEKTDLHTDAFPLTTSTIPAGSETSRSKQTKILGISAAAMLLGGAAWAVAQKIQQSHGESSVDSFPTVGLTAEPVAEPTTRTLPADIDVAGKVTDSMSFDQAFAAARDEVGTGGVFSWHGHWYNTFDKAEWTGLSLEQRQEYTEMITGEKLPIRAYAQSTTPETDPAAQTAPVASEPTVIEGYLNGQPVIGLDFDQDGVIDTLVMDGADGHLYSIVDATGSEGLDTLYQYDAQSGELTGVAQLEQPFLLSNDDFSQALENSMSEEVVDSILEPEAADGQTATEETATEEENTEATEPTEELSDDQPAYLADTDEPQDDTYNNNGDVRDLDE